MSKIALDRLTSSFSFQAAYNEVLASIEEEFSERVLYRNNPVGEPNNMLNDLDMSGNDIINVGLISAEGFNVGGTDITSSLVDLLAHVDQAVIDIDADADRAEAAADEAESIASGLAGLIGFDTALAASDGASLVGYGDRTVASKLADSINVKDYGATPSTATDQSSFFHAAFAAAVTAGIGKVVAEGTYRFTSNLILRNGVSLLGPNRDSLILEMDNCYVTNETGIGEYCTNTDLRATIVAVNTSTDLYGLVLEGIEFCDFDIKVEGFNSASSIGIYLRSVLDDATWRYARNNCFHNVRVDNCYNGIRLDKHASDPATFGANFNTFLGGYVSGYSNVGIRVEFGEANCFFGTRCTTSIGSGSIGWLIADSVNGLFGCTADGSFGGTVPGTLNVYGFPHGRDGDTTTKGFQFNTGSNGSCLIHPRGDACYNRVTADSQATIDTIEITGRYDFNWIPSPRIKQLLAQSISAAVSAAIFENTSASSAILAEFKNAASTYNVLLKVLSNGALQFGSADSDTQFISGNTTGTPLVRGRFLATNGSFQPEGDNSQTLGASSKRWSVVYAGTGTINTSDGRLKEQVRDLEASEKKVAKKLKKLLRLFKFTDSVETKGESARWHCGLVAQDVANVFIEEGLDPSKYSLFCYDEWNETPEILSEDGSVEQVYIPAGNRYGIRYDELVCFILGGM